MALPGIPYGSSAAGGLPAAKPARSPATAAAAVHTSSVNPVEQENVPPTLEDLLDQLQTAFPRVDIQLIPEGTVLSAGQYAQQVQGGIHLGVSAEWLKRCLQQPNGWQTCQNQLQTALERLSNRWTDYLSPDSKLVGAGGFIDAQGQLSYWTTELNEAESPTFSATESKSGTSASNYKNTKELAGNLSILNSQLLRCVTQQDVRTVLGQAYGSLVRLKKCRPGEYSNTAINKLMNATQKTIQCAKVKLRNLQEEQQLRKRSEKAAAKRKLDQAAELRREMEARRKKHRVGEYNLLPHPVPQFDEEQQRREEEHWEQMVADLTGDIAVPTVPAALPMGGMAIDAVMSGAPVTITVTPAVSLSA